MNLQRPADKQENHSVKMCIRDLAEKLAPAEKAWVHLRIRFCFFSYHLDVGLSSIAFSDRSQTAPKTGLAEEISRMIVDATAQEDGARPQN